MNNGHPTTGRQAMLNCLIVAMWIWLGGRCRGYIFARRSLHFLGKVLHFGTADAGRWKMIKVIEYIPPKKDLWTRRNILLVFEGTYRVWYLRPVSVRRFLTKEQAVADYYLGNR